MRLQFFRARFEETLVARLRNGAFARRGIWLGPVILCEPSGGLPATVAQKVLAREDESGNRKTPRGFP